MVVTASIINYCVNLIGGSSVQSTCLVKLSRSCKEYKIISQRFQDSWSSLKGTCAELTTAFAVVNPTIEQRFSDYVASLRRRGAPSHIEQYFHGTILQCDIAKSQKLCNEEMCAICGICKRGFDEKLIATHIPTWMRFGMGMYLAPNSSKCHEYTRGAHCHRAMLWCDVAPGSKWVVAPPDDVTFSHTTECPQGYDCIYGHQGCLNYDEIVFYNSRAIIPRYVIVYQKDGVEQVATNRLNASEECPSREECPARVTMP